MFIALVDQERREATPGARALCPGCNKPVLAKCGDVVTWHWAHVTGCDCDTWHEPISEWHLQWQRQAPVDRREVSMGPHRADIVLLDGRVVEVQHSPIAPKTIIERVRYYGPDMLWIFDARDAWTARDLVIQRVTAATVSWKWLRGIGDRRLVGGAETFFDTGAFLLEPRKGYIVPRVSMCALIAEGTPLPPPDYAYLDSLAEIGNQKWRADMHKQAERVRQQEEDGRRLAEIERKEQEELRLREQKEKEERERWPPCADCGDPESFKCRRDGCAKCCFCRTRREAAEELAASEVQRAAIEMRRASKEQLQQMFVDAVARQTTGPR